MSTRTARRGFTLIELIVSVAILALLIALLMPAIMRVREASARLKCGNNLKQLSLAIQAYEAANRALPPGVTLARRNQPFPRTTWIARLLPYLEQTPLWERTVSAFAQDNNAINNPPHVGFGTAMGILSCPSDGRAESPQSTHNGLRPALTNYLGVIGTDYLQRDGVLFEDSRIVMSDILDGTANTIALGERPPSPDCWFGWWYTGTGQDESGSPDFLLGVHELYFAERPYVTFCFHGRYRFGPGAFDNQCDVFHFWSPHPGGAHFAFCDGSVRFLAYSADSILPALATRAGGEAVSLPD
jgi:prepilin-type N-terminal cleavage/methylation domain-containing protein/prepilin-type processing-associated H-X9-DG protein